MTAFLTLLTNVVNSMDREGGMETETDRQREGEGGKERVGEREARRETDRKRRGWR